MNVACVGCAADILWGAVSRRRRISCGLFRVFDFYGCSVDNEDLKGSSRTLGIGKNIQKVGDQLGEGAKHIYLILTKHFV